MGKARDIPAVCEQCPRQTGQEGRRASEPRSDRNGRLDLDSHALDVPVSDVYVTVLGSVGGRSGNISNDDEGLKIKIYRKINAKYWEILRIYADKIILKNVKYAFCHRLIIISQLN